MRPIVANGALGVIVLLDATSLPLGADCEYWLTSLRAIREDFHFVIGISKADITPTFSLGDVREGARRCGSA
jgi:signal recognition particle receptor subunit beta